MPNTQKFLQAQRNDLSDSLIDFFKSTNFSHAIMVGFALLIPILVGHQLGHLSIGIAVAVGALLASPSDVEGSFRLKITGILLSNLLAMLITLIGGYLHLSLWSLFPLLGLLVFSISYLSIFGFRASLISFSGLFALILSFSNLNDNNFPPYIQALLIGLGGFWYLIMAYVYGSIFKKTPIQNNLITAFHLTADYIATRGKLIDKNDNRTELYKEIFQLQSALTEVHETLRELLISSRKGSGKSNHQIKNLLLFIELIDMLELAIANPVNYDKTDALFEKKPQQRIDFQRLLFAMADRLRTIGNQLGTPQNIDENQDLENLLAQLEKDIHAYELEVANQFDENALMLKNFYKYQKNQVEKIRNIEWHLQNKGQKELNKLRKNDLRNFLTQPDYNLNLLLENFNFKSSIFLHSLRIAVVTLVGYSVGLLFELQNPYWILLTIVMIMRPTYGLTKTRSRQRTIGTLIGGLVAVGFVFLIDNVYVFAVLAFVSFVISFAMLQNNYKSSAAFITLSVVFTYALMEPDVYHVIQFRVIDTLMGTALATAANLWLWPAWEIKSFDTTLLGVLKANRKYLKEVSTYYQNVGEPRQEYRLSRKQAFLAMSELNASFQRMAQEPKAQQNNLDKIYEIAMLNHTFLVASASLGTYAIHHPTTPASENFHQVMTHIDENLAWAEKILTEKLTQFSIPTSQEIIQSTYGEQLKEIVQLDAMDDQVEMNLKIEEAHLVFELLKWLLSLSHKNLKLLNETEW